jgi:hypothetical protein
MIPFTNRGIIWGIKVQKEIIYMPNEIFSDLQNSIKSSKHIAFAYAYYYYVCYLYRYCHYIDDNGKMITQPAIKEFLGYAATYKPIDFLIKKDGKLDEIGYTETTTNYPLLWKFEAETGELSFESIADLKELDKSFSAFLNKRNFKVKLPVKAFYRYKKDQERQGWFTGTFYNVQYTHSIEYSTFNAIISNKKLGTMGLYLYGYLKHKCSAFPAGYQASANVLRTKLKIGGTASVFKYINALDECNFIEVERKSFSFDSIDKEANTYKIPHKGKAI